MERIGTCRGCQAINNPNFKSRIAIPHTCGKEPKAIRSKVAYQHLKFPDIDFNCPYCNKEYSDVNDFYFEKCKKSEDSTTKITCQCGKRFGMTYNYMGNAQSFKLIQKNEKRTYENGKIQ